MKLFSKKKREDADNLKMLASVPDLVPTVLMTIDKDFNITFLNKAGLNLLGQSWEQVKGKKCYSYFKTPHCQTSECRCGQAIDKNSTFSGETIADPDGLNLPIMYTGAPLKDQSGNITGAIEYVIDMTDIKNVVIEVNRTAKKIIEGDLSVRAEAGNAQGDYKSLINGVNDVINNILEPVNESMQCLEQVAQGDLTVSVKGDYVGDHAKMKNALNLTIEKLDSILNNVASAVEQVSSGSKQVSDSSQSLSQGATEQASSLEEVTSSITEIASQTKTNAESATQANGLASGARENADTGNSKMKNMTG
jgi:methyl-accepting chemotaxis protein